VVMGISDRIAVLDHGERSRREIRRKSVQIKESSRPILGKG